MSTDKSPWNFKNYFNHRYVVVFFIGLGTVLLYLIVSRDISVKSEKSLEPNSIAYVSAMEGLNLRKSASLKSERIKVLPYHQKVKIIEREGEWYLVEIEGENGWLSAQYLTKQKPKEQSVRYLDYNALVGQVDGVSVVLPVEYRDFNADSREDVLITLSTHGVNEEKQYFVYSYEDGIRLVKLLEVSPKETPYLYLPGYRGFSSLEFIEGKFLFSYPLFSLEDPLCCPSQEGAHFELKLMDNKFVY